MVFHTLEKKLGLKNNFQSLYRRSENRTRALDGIRAFSIITTVFFHSYYMLSFFMTEEGFRAFSADLPFALVWVTRGDYGVDAFFTLSGFLIASMLMKEHIANRRINIKRFYIRRLMRLYPVFLCVIFFCTIGLFVSGETLGKLWVTAIYAINFLPYDERIIKWSWSLAVEEQFYILFPLLLVAIFRFCNRPFLALLFVFFMSFLARYWVLLNNPALAITDTYYMVFENTKSFSPLFIEKMYGNLHTRYGAIFAGILAAYLQLYHREKLDLYLSDKYWLNNLLTLASITIIVVLLSIPLFGSYFSQLQNEWFSVFFQSIHRTLFGVGIACLILCVSRTDGLSSIINRLLSARVFYPIAQLSYGIYLIHLPITFIASSITYKVMSGFGYSHPALLIFPVAIACLCICLVISSCLFVLIEKPFLNMRK